MAIPTEHLSRAVQAFLRGPVGLNTFGFGTVDAYRGGVQHMGLMAEFPAPQDNPLNDFGIQTGGGFTVELMDEPGTADWFLTLEDGYCLLAEDGSRLVMEY
jgi:hypothetical protein